MDEFSRKLWDIYKTAREEGVVQVSDLQSGQWNGHNGSFMVASICDEPLVLWVT